MRPNHLWSGRALAGGLATAALVLTAAAGCSVGGPTTKPAPSSTREAKGTSGTSASAGAPSGAAGSGTAVPSASVAGSPEPSPGPPTAYPIAEPTIPVGRADQIPDRDPAALLVALAAEFDQQRQEAGDVPVQAYAEQFGDSAARVREVLSGFDVAQVRATWGSNADLEARSAAVLKMVNGPQAGRLAEALTQAVMGKDIGVAQLPKDVFGRLTAIQAVDGSNRYCVIGLAPIAQFLAVETVCHAPVTAVNDGRAKVIRMLTDQSAAIDASRSQ